MHSSMLDYFGKGLCNVGVDQSVLATELRNMVLENVAFDYGAKLVLHHLKKNLEGKEESGSGKADTGILFCTYVPTQLKASWCFLMGRLNTFEAHLSLQWLTQLRVLSNQRACLPHLPDGIQSLTCDDPFNQNLEVCPGRSVFRALTFGLFFKDSTRVLDAQSVMKCIQV